jgi:hypothetical protein
MQKLIGWFPKPTNGSFPACLLQHRLAKIQPGKINLIPKTITQGKKNIPTPGGKIENILRTPLLRKFDQPVTPVKIDPAGEPVVGKIVAWGNT